MTGPSPALAVTRIRLAAFRSYAAGEVAPGGQSVALYGPNGSGKTNLVEAVSLFVPGRGLRRAEPGALARGGPAGRIGWRVRAEIATPEGSVEAVTGADGEDTRRTVEIDGKSAPQTRLGALMRMVWLTPAMDRLWAEAAGERRRFLDRMAMGFFPAHADTALAYEKAMRARNRLLKEGPADPVWLGALERQMAEAGARIARVRVEALAAIREAVTDAETVFPRPELAIEGQAETRLADDLSEGAEMDAAEAREAATLRGDLEAGRAQDAAAGRTLSGPHRSDLEAVFADKGMPARLCSTGEQKALLISVVLANARALASRTGWAPVLLLDEVAAHLDADRRAALYGEIGALGAQAWMTGTGPELFDGLSGDALRLAVSEGPDGSRLAPA